MLALRPQLARATVNLRSIGRRRTRRQKAMRPWPSDHDVAAGRHAGSIWGGNRLDRAWSRAAPAPCLAVGTEGFLCSLPACSPRSAAVRGGSGVRGGGGALALVDRSSSATSFLGAQNAVLNCPCRLCIRARVIGRFLF